MINKIYNILSEEVTVEGQEVTNEEAIESTASLVIGVYNITFFIDRTSSLRITDASQQFPSIS